METRNQSSLAQVKPCRDILVRACCSTVETSQEFRLKGHEYFGLTVCGRVYYACWTLPRGPIVVPFWGSSLEPYQVIPKRNYYGASG